MRELPELPLTERISWQRYGLVLLALLFILGVLRFYPLHAMNYSGLIVVVVLAGWLSYHFLAPLRLLRRRALLAHVTTSDSSIRRWFWNSMLSRLVWSLQALVAGVLVLLVAAGTSAPEWWVMAGGSLLFPFLLAYAARLTEPQIQPGYRRIAQLRLAYWMVLIPVIIGSVVAQLLWAEVSDTRTLPLLTVVSAAFQAQMDEAAVPFTGLLLGGSAASEAGVWHLMQLASSSAEASSGLKAGAWAIFLLFNALKAGVVWTVLAGAGHLLLSAGARAHTTLLGEQRFSRVFNTTIVLMFLAYLALTQLNVGSLLVPVREQLRTSFTGMQRCERGAIIEQQQIVAGAQRELTLQQQEMRSRMEAEIDRYLNAVFEQAEAGVERFLDWNFSLQGQYTQLLFMGASAVGEQSFTHYIANRMDEFITESAADEVPEMYSMLGTAFQRDAEALYISQAVYLERLIGDASCIELPPLDIELGEFSRKSAVGAGSGAGVLAARASMRVGSRAVGRNATRHVVSATFARLSSRLGVSAAAGSVGSFCGPLVVICAPLLAAGTWVATDLAINEIDEAWNRDRMRDDMLGVLQEERLRWKKSLVAQYDATLAQVAADLEAYRLERFNIIRDGL